MHVFYIFCLVFILINGSLPIYTSHSVVEKSFINSKIAPEVILRAPTNYIEVEFPGAVHAVLGNILIPNEVKNQPSVSWNANPNRFYTLACVDPDAVTPQGPMIGQFLHWLVVNIPGNSFRCGEVLASYYPPTPPDGSGLHRYTFLVYRQKHWINFEEPRLLQTTTDNRTEFFIYKFSQKYGLGNPIAGNYYLSQFNTDN